MYSSKNYIKTILIVMIFFAIFGIIGEYYLPVVMICIFACLSATSTLTYDENYHWDEYQLVLPISKKMLVGSKYILFLIFVLGCFCISLIYISLVCIFDKSALFSELMTVVFSGIVTSTFLSAPIFPLTYKFGSNKISLYLAVIGFVPMVVIFIVNHLFNLNEVISPFIGHLKKMESAGSLWVLAIGCIIICALFTMISYFISLKIFENKEY